MKKTLIFLLIIGGWTSFSFAHHHTVYYVQPPTVLVATSPQIPPVAIVEPVPAQPGPGYVWIPGHWNWCDRWVWEQGYWTGPNNPGVVVTTDGWYHYHHHHY